MKTLASILMASASLSVAVPAFAAEESASSNAKVERKDNGGYSKEANAERVTADGKQTSQTKVDLSVDDDGDREKTTTTTETNDPKGLFNKDKVKTTTTEKRKDGKVSVESKKTVNGDTVRETSKSY